MISVNIVFSNQSSSKLLIKDGNQLKPTIKKAKRRENNKIEQYLDTLLFGNNSEGNI